MTTDTATHADTLRQAAQLIRANAEAATDGPWTTSLVWSPDSHATSGIYSTAHPAGSTASEVVASGRRNTKGFGGIRNPRDARHMAAWQPAVALAVADWLDAEASIHEMVTAAGITVRAHTSGKFTVNALESTLPQALAVARAYIEAATR